MTAALREVPAPPVDVRVNGLPWPQLHADLDARGFAHVPALLTPSECRRLVALYEEPRRFRGRVVMARHGFGRGEYR